MIEIDEAWLQANPLPVHRPGTDKNARGRVLLVGGAKFVPGALRLSGEAALRAGCGKLQLATVADVATALGVLMPEAAMMALPAEAEGEIASTAAAILAAPLQGCDTLIIGPGMSEHARTAELVGQLLATPRADLTILLDAAAATCARDLARSIADHEGRVLLTPHFGEMAAITGRSREEIAADPARFARLLSEELGALIVLKSESTIIAAPGRTALTLRSDCVGLATGGSGDVLAGVIGGLMARGADPMTAAAWGVVSHAAAGRHASKLIGPIGFLASDLLGFIPALIDEPFGSDITGPA
ncbi:yjeF C-terminal region, hydroxyethylthiazole kinase-related [Sphingomonas laterariae]|uniref:ADP-dependent (S)-NAD(P)H-hydrate dehydratase n=1 Tax=Edaphosphingomonas laterariae TaxID=861865 RepID=A0A239I2C1_9SPHN|nr:NAD(P)H-hydrate dehydratase [Sphingomonas laterariae]SNS87810.1 yjeF C-terminal region, hydroxyethylthiazole kinase-related [Sphingomonas laterariae]